MDRPTVNLWEATMLVFEKIEKDWEDDVLYIAGNGKNGKVELDKDSFEFLAKSTDYDPGYGSQEIDAGLLIVFIDGTWLERWEYDGSEGWEYKKPPQRPDKKATLDTYRIKYKSIWEK